MSFTPPTKFEKHLIDIGYVPYRWEDRAKKHLVATSYNINADEVYQYRRDDNRINFGRGIQGQGPSLLWPRPSVIDNQGIPDGYNGLHSDLDIVMVRTLDKHSPDKIHEAMYDALIILRNE